MSANDTTCLSEAAQTLDAIIHPSLSDLMLSHTFLSLLIPLFISLFYFSTPQSRKTPIFVLNVAAVLLAFAIGVLCDVIAIHSILQPLSPWLTTVDLAIGLTAVWQYLLVDLTLLIRVISVYPLACVGVMRFAILITIPVLLKVARVVNLTLFTKALIDAANGPDAAVMVGVVFSTAPYIKLEWGAQVIDNAYASIAFLWRLHSRGNTRIMSDYGRGRATFSQRVRTLFKISLANFVIPTMFSIVQFVCLYRNVDMVTMNQIMLVNTMVATFGVAFATIWAGSNNRRKAHTLDSSCNNTGSSLMMTFGGGPRHPDSVNQSSTAIGSRGTAKCSGMTVASLAGTVDLHDEKESE